MTDSSEKNLPDVRFALTRREFMRFLALMGMTAGSGVLLASCAPPAATEAPTAAAPEPTATPAGPKSSSCAWQETLRVSIRLSWLVLPIA